MKLKYLPIFLLILCLSSCSTPIGKFFSKTKKVEDVKRDISKNEDKTVEVGKTYIYGADYTLSLDPNPNRYNEVAKGFTQRSLLTLGNPSMEEANELREIVKNLISTNQSLIIKGQKALAEKDEKVADLQKENNELLEKLGVQEAKLNAVNAENAKLATTWKRITSSFWWIVWIVVIGFVLSILGKVLPPPYNSIAMIVAAPVGLVIRFFIGLLPSAKKAAGVVAEKTHEESQSALEKLVLSINELKKQNPKAFEELSPILKDKTTDATRTKIDEIKKDYDL